MSKDNGCSPSRGAAIAAALGKSAVYVLLFVGSQFFISLLAVAVISAVMVGSLGYFDGYALYDAVMKISAEMTLLSGLLTLAVVAVFYRLRRRELRRELWLRPVGRQVWLTVVGLAMMLYWLVTLLFSLLPMEWLESYAEASAPLDETGLMMTLGTVVVAPVVEEVIFRGLVLSRLNRAMPGWPALLLSSAVFGVLHGHPVWALYAGLLGVAFGLVAMRTGSILPTIVMHITFNGIGQLHTVFAVSETAYLVFELVFAVVSAAAVIALRGRFWVLMDGRGLSRCPYGRLTLAQPAEGAGAVEAPEGERPDAPPVHSGQAQWDGDSGAQHRFTVNDL